MARRSVLKVCKETKMKAICVINTSGNYGGAEKRIVALFDHINRKRDDFSLIINGSIYDAMIEKGVLTSQNRVEIIYIPFDKKTYSNSKSVLKKRGTDRNSIKTIRNRLGRLKYFLKTTVQWILFSKQLISILKRNSVTSVYTIWEGGIWGRVWYKWLKIRIIYGANSNLVWHLEKNLFSMFDSQYRIIRDTNHVDFLSNGLVDELQNLMSSKDFPKSYSVSPCSFISYENYFPEYPKENSVVFMGRLVALKNPILFLEAVKIFNESFRQFGNVNFIVLGTGPFESKMRNFVEKNGLANVSIKGKVSQPESYLRRSKVFVTIQQTENYPSQALMEAMACENAVIASDVGETREIVTGDEGILVKLEAQDIAKALAKLLDDDDARLLMGQNARKKVLMEHTVERFTAYFLELNEMSTVHQKTS